MNEVYPEISEEDYEEESSQELTGEVVDSEEDFGATLVDPGKFTTAYYIRKAESALDALKNIVKENGWKKVLTHNKSGVVVYSKQGESKESKIPVFMGQQDIEGFPPQSVFSVIGMRRLWDELYEEGNLVENLDNTTSLTYMVMHGMAGSKTRDFSLVEKVDCESDGTIYFVSTSVITPKIPPCVGKVRANIKLNGWVLQPTSEDPFVTKVTYILQSDVRGWIPSVFARKYLARRPLVIHTIKTYLLKNGPPVMVYSPSNSRRSSYVSSQYTIEQPKVNEGFDTMKSNVIRQRMLLSKSEDDVDSLKVSNVIVSREASATSEDIRDSVNINEDSLIQSSTASANEEHLTAEYSSEVLASSEASSNVEEEVTEIPEPAKQVIVHRHTESLKNALHYLKSLYDNINDWTLYTENKGVKVFTMDGGKPMPIMRGDFTYTGYAPEDVLSVVANVDFRKLWDDRFDEGSTYERWSLGETLTRSAMKGTFPVSGRDMALINTVDRDPETGTIYFVSTSVIDQVIPLSKKHVRADLKVAGWILKPKQNESGIIEAVDASYIVEIDIKLDSIPTSILKSISMQTPMCVVKVNDVIQKYGFPPYVKRLSGMLSHEGFSDKTFQCDFTLKMDEEGIAEIQTSKIMYPNGLDISIKPESVKVELAYDNRELIRLTMPAETDSREVKVTITKNSSKVNKMTCNKTQNIPVASPEKEGATVMSPTPEVKFSSSQAKKTFENSAINYGHPENDNKSSSPTLVKKEPIQVPVMETVNINKINKKITPDDHDVKLVDKHFIQQPESVIPTKIPEVTRQSFTDKLARDESRDEILTSKILTVGRNISISDFTENIKLDPQKIGLMIASMILAFYAGKMSNHCAL